MEWSPKDSAEGYRLKKRELAYLLAGILRMLGKMHTSLLECRSRLEIHELGSWEVYTPTSFACGRACDPAGVPGDGIPQPKQGLRDARSCR